MKAFGELFDRIDQTNSIKEKIHYIQEYFTTAPSDDAAWALYFLSGNKLKRLIGPNKLFEWCIDSLSLPSWLILESYSAVGDIAETIALLLPHKTQKNSQNFSLAEWIEKKILPLQQLTTELQKEKILFFWQELDQRGVFILNKILTGSLRVGVSQLITLEALSKALNISKETLSQRLMGTWTPSAEFFENLKKDESLSFTSELNPYPFFLASPIEDLENLGNPDEWVAEWKWDGIRAQCIKRSGKIAIWSRRNELITKQFPEICKSLENFDSDMVLDGEILAFKNEKPLPFSSLQKRLGRKDVSRVLMELVPIVFMIYDVLEFQEKDLRKIPFVDRRKILETQIEVNKHVTISPLIPFKSWNELKIRRNEAPSNLTEGLMLKKKSSSYGAGRRKGSWWKYKIDPRTIDAVLIYAQPGHGWRANLYTDYTFGVWHHDELVPIAKAYSGLSQDEIFELDQWIRRNTEEKFGPVRKVRPEQVFEIAFEGVQRSLRHKSGVAFRFPRITKWRTDKLPSECDTLEKIKIEFLQD